MHLCYQHSFSLSSVQIVNVSVDAVNAAHTDDRLNAYDISFFDSPSLSRRLMIGSAGDVLPVGLGTVARPVLSTRCGATSTLAAPSNISNACSAIYGHIRAEPSQQTHKSLGCTRNNIL
jgi:hypothetical protein